MKLEERESIERRFDPIKQALLTHDPTRLPLLYPDLAPKEVPVQPISESELDQALTGNDSFTVESMDTKDALEVLRMLGHGSTLSGEDLEV